MMMLRRHLATALVAIVLAGATFSCRPGASTATSPSGSASNRQVYQVKGVIKDLRPDRKKVTIAHEAIPDYMEAMTMDFEVKNARELKGLQRGDSVSFRMIVTETEGWIDQLKKLETPRTPLPSAPPPNFRRVREVEPLTVGEKMPDYAFTNTQRQVVRLSDFPGQALAFTFVFTRCPFPNFCPRLSGNFSEVQTKVQALADGPTNWHLFSITIDPEYDTPDRLRAYAERYRADPKRWDFVTGELIDITAIGEQFGLQFWRSDPSEPVNHNVRTVVVDASGRVRWISTDNEWKAETLVDQLTKAARARPGS